MKLLPRIAFARHGLWLALFPFGVFLFAPCFAQPSTCVAPAPGLVAWWPGDGNAQDIVGGHNGTLLNGATFAAGKVGQAFSFDGADDKITVPDSDAFKLNSLTIEAWIFIKGFNPAPILVRGDSRPGLDPYLLGTDPSGALVFLIAADNVKNISLYSNITGAQWKHVAATFDGATGTMRIYIDGKWSVETTTTVRPLLDLDPTRQPSIGIGNVGEVNNFPFNGLIDEISLYNRALSASEVQVIYDAASAGKCRLPSPPSIVSHPASKTVTVGDTVTFSVTAHGTTPLSYQWYMNEAPLAGSTQASVTLPNVQLAQSGNYFVVVGNAAGSVTSAVAALTVNVAPPYDLARDFSPVANPNGVWSFGWQATLGGSFNLLTVHGPTAGDNGVPVDYWLVGPSDYPGLYHNSTTNTATSNGGRGIHPPGSTWYLPGPSGSGRDFGVIRFTAQSSGAYQVETTVGPYLNGPPQGDTDFHVLRNDVELFGRNLAAGVSATYSNILDLSAGQTIDLAVGRGADNNNYGSALAITATVRFATPTPPVIVTQPQNQVAVIGSTPTFSVTATGTAPLSYQWRFNDVDLAGATQSSLTLPNVQLSQAGNYSVVVANGAGSVTSAVLVLTVNFPPPCVPPPQGLVAWWTGDGTADDLVGSNHGSLRNGARFAPGMVGQGFSLDGVDDFVLIPDSGSLDLTNGLTLELWFKSQEWSSVHSSTLIDKRTSDNCNYGAIVSEPWGFQLYYNDPTVFGGDHPGNLFEIAAHFPLPTLNSFHHFAGTYRQADSNHLELKMYLDGTLVESRLFQGNLTRTLNAMPLAIGAARGGAGEFFKGVIDEVSLYNRTLSATEIQSIYDAGTAGKCRAFDPIKPSIIVQPTSRTVTDGSTATFSVTATGTAPLSYQWRFNDVDLAGATQSLLTLLNVQSAQAGNYSVVVGNSAGSATSAVAVLTVNPPTLPSIVTPPFSRTVTVGATATFSVTAAGTPPLSYQWLFNDGAIAGATQASLTLSSVQMAQAGSYSVVVSNAAGAVTSPAAALSVRPGPSTVRVVNVNAAASAEVRVPIQLLAQGNENALSFSLSFDSSLLAFNELVLGGNMPASATLLLNTNSTSSGRVGLAVALATGATFTAGTQEVAAVKFTVAPVPNPITIPITFGDQPTGRQVSDAQALATPAAFVSGNVTVSASTVRVVSTSAASAGEALVPVQLLAQGNENALGFSLNFDNSLLALNEVVLGANVPSGAALVLNTNAGSGRVGVAIALSAGTAFDAGTQDVAVVKFAVAPVLNPVTIPITFGDQPTARQLSDRQARVLPAVFVSGNVAIAQVEFEGDVAPRPGGNKTVSITDWVQLGRFVAGLDQIGSPSEFQRVDCAPRSSKGNGAISVSDWVQAGRYAVGLDPLTPAGGPTGPDTGGAPPLPGVPPPPVNRALCILDTSIPPGLTSAVSVRLEAQGEENALGFSVAFDPARMSFMGAVAGAGASGATLNVNTNQVDAGRIGLVLALQPGSTLSAGTQEILVLSFTSMGSASGSTTVSFSDQPLLRETADALANPLDTTYTSGTVSFTAPAGPRLTFTRTEDTLILSWPASVTGFELESATGGPGALWNPVAGVIVVGDQKISAVSFSGGQKFFRLKKP